MKLKITREALLKPLQMVAGVVEKRQTLPILSHVLLKVSDKELSITGTDLEVELIAQIALDSVEEAGEITVPARKLIDICRSLPENADIQLSIDKEKFVIRSGRGRYTLSTLSSNDFPSVDDGPGAVEFTMGQAQLHELLEKTHFCMAQQDVRYYLNGLLLEIDAKSVRVVATDGHRLATSVKSVNTKLAEKTQVIVPRKGILELMRLLDKDNADANLSVVVSENHIRAIGEDFTFTSKLTLKPISISGPL